MYLAVLTIILGQAVPFGSWWLVLYAVIVLAGVVAFVKGLRGADVRPYLRPAVPQLQAQRRRWPELPRFAWM
ncbi:MAG: hypothetical protein ABI568_07650 [Pseudarthrobacter sp.]